MTTDLLKRSFAPIVDEAWTEIDREARRVLILNLAARKLVVFDGPYGWAHAAANTGRLTLLETSPAPSAFAGVRVVQPLLEIRVPFELEMMELDNVSRGAKNVSLHAVVEAAETIARAEDHASSMASSRARSRASFRRHPIPRWRCRTPRSATRKSSSRPARCCGKPASTVPTRWR